MGPSPKRLPAISGGIRFRRSVGSIPIVQSQFRVHVQRQGRAALIAVSGELDLASSPELEASLGIRIGRHYEKFGLSSGNGYFVAASYREQQCVRFAGLTISYSIDLALAR